jgi:hypothetical protein
MGITLSFLGKSPLKAFGTCEARKEKVNVRQAE